MYLQLRCVLKYFRRFRLNSKGKKQREKRISRTRVRYRSAGDIKAFAAVRLSKIPPHAEEHDYALGEPRDSHGEARRVAEKLGKCR